MKNKTFWIICLLILIGFTLSRVCKSNLKYPEGKGTIKTFGDGTYQISSGSNESLFNEEYGNCIIQQVEKIHETDHKAYIVGTTVSEGVVDGLKVERRYKIHAVIELENNTMMLCITKNDPSQPDLFIYRLDEMVDSGDVCLIMNLSDFSNEDLERFLLAQ